MGWNRRHLELPVSEDPAVHQHRPPAEEHHEARAGHLHSSALSMHAIMHEELELELSAMRSAAVRQRARQAVMWMDSDSLLLQMAEATGTGC